MPNLMDLLQGHLSPDVVNQLSQQVGADPEQTQDAAHGIMSALLGGLAKNAATPQGASALSDALAKDHDGGILGNIMGAISGNAPAGVSSSALDGAGILSHILGGNQGNIMQMIAQATGMDQGAIGALMLKLAPLVMGVLGQQKAANGLNPSGLSSLLTSTVSGMSQNTENPLMQMAQQVLSGAAGGNSSGSGGGLLGMAKSLLGGLFK